MPTTLNVVKETVAQPGMWWRDGKVVTVTTSAGDYTTPDGYYHQNGVYQVRATNADGTPYKGKAYKGRAKTFRGETAWMDAQRLHDDVVTEVRFT